MKAAAVGMQSNVVTVSASSGPGDTGSAQLPVTTVATLAGGDPVTELKGGELPGLTAGTHPDGITSGRDGHIWFTENGLSGAGAVARLNADGSVTEFSGGVAFSSRPTCNPQTSTTTTPPALSQLVIRPARFRAGRGATISYVDSEPATARFTVARTQPGVRVGSRCAASKRRRGVRHCSRLIVVDSFQHTDVSGGSTVHLPGAAPARDFGPAATRWLPSRPMPRAPATR